jgi:hypothetical protein
MHIDIEELKGELKYRYQIFDIERKAIDFKKQKRNMNQ